MSSTKRASANPPITSSNIILDIEGTTTSITFVKDVLFPYVREHLEAYVKENWDSQDFQAIVNALRTQAIEDAEKKLDGVIEIPKEGDKDTLVTSVVESVVWQMNHDRKTKSLKDLQGLIMENGYKKGELKGHVYEDVKPSLELWTEQGKSVYIYSSGSVHAQKLLFGHSENGDLLPFIKGHFDTTFGMKGDADSYKKIVEEISSSPSEVVFFTDVPKEARAAKEAGLLGILLSRDGNAPLTEEDQSEFQVITSFIEIQFENHSKKRKICDDKDENKSIEVCEVYVKNPKEPTNPTLTLPHNAAMEVEESPAEVKNMNIEVSDSNLEVENGQQKSTVTENGDVEMETISEAVQEKKIEKDNGEGLKSKTNNGLAHESHDEIEKETKSEKQDSEGKKQNEENESCKIKSDESSVLSNNDQKELEKSANDNKELVEGHSEETAATNNGSPPCEAEISINKKTELKESDHNVGNLEISVQHSTSNDNVNSLTSKGEKQTNASGSGVTTNGYETNNPTQEINTDTETVMKKNIDLLNNKNAVNPDSNSQENKEPEVEIKDLNSQTNDNCKQNGFTDTNKLASKLGTENTTPLNSDNNTEVEEKPCHKADEGNVKSGISDDLSQNTPSKDLHSDEKQDEKEGKISKTEILKESITTSFNSTVAMDCCKVDGGTQEESSSIKIDSEIEKVGNGVSEDNESNKIELETGSEDSKPKPDETQITESETLDKNKSLIDITIDNNTPEENGNETQEVKKLIPGGVQAEDMELGDVNIKNTQENDEKSVELFTKIRGQRDLDNAPVDSKSKVDERVEDNSVVPQEQQTQQENITGCQQNNRNENNANDEEKTKSHNSANNIEDNIKEDVKNDMRNGDNLNKLKDTEGCELNEKPHTSENGKKDVDAKEANSSHNQADEKDMTAENDESPISESKKCEAAENATVAAAVEA